MMLVDHQRPLSSGGSLVSYNNGGMISVISGSSTLETAHSMLRASSFGYRETQMETVHHLSVTRLDMPSLLPPGGP